LKFRRFFRNEKTDIPWQHVMPAHAYKSEVKRIVGDLKETLCNLNLSYYEKYFKRQNHVFQDLRPAKINVPLLLDLLKEDTTGHLKSFLPEHGGFAPVPSYTRIGTRTGRLKVKRGPMILNIKKEHRKVLQSRFPGGSIWQLDYSSLEPRILLACQDKLTTVPQDIYQDVLDEYDLSNIPREAIKTCVLSRIYGATDTTITKQIKYLVDYPEDVVRIVDEYFDIDELRQNLSSELSINAGSHITNFYGRRIVCGDTPLYVLLNYYLQSTGVDVALFGFGKVANKLKEAEIMDRIVPLYVLHDALFLDVHPDLEYLLPKLCKVGSLDIPKFENTNFHLQASKEV